MFQLFRWDMRLTDVAVIRAIARLEHPASQAEIAEGLGCNRKTVNRSLKRLRSIVRPEGGGRGSPYTYSIDYEALPDDLRKELCPK